MIELQTSKPLRILDFTRLQSSHGEGLSYFQDDFNAEIERRAFLRRLHTLISQPVIPGRESDYLITQTLAEYLAHVHQVPFDGILFKSVQREGGVNVVLFPQRDQAVLGRTTFPISYVAGSFKFFATKSIEYDQERHLLEHKDGTVAPIVEYDD